MTPGPSRRATVCQRRPRGAGGKGGDIPFLGLGLGLWWGTTYGQACPPHGEPPPASVSGHQMRMHGSWVQVLTRPQAPWSPPLASVPRQQSGSNAAVAEQDNGILTQSSTLSHDRRGGGGSAGQTVPNKAAMPAQGSQQHPTRSPIHLASKTLANGHEHNTLHHPQLATKQGLLATDIIFSETR